MKWGIFFLSFFLIGCSSKKFIYLDTNVTKNNISSNKLIGVKNIDVPMYMKDLEIMEVKNNILTPTSFYLSRDIKSLMISYLSYELNDPYVFDYPFLNKKPDFLLKIYIDDFFLKGGYVYLKSRVLINDKFLTFFLKNKCKKNYRCVGKILKDFSKRISKEIE